VKTIDIVDNPADMLTKLVSAHKSIHCLDLLRIGRRR